MALRSSSCKSVSASSAGSSISASASSSSCLSERRLSAESALLRRWPITRWNLRLRFETLGLAPDDEENLADQILGERSVVDKAQDETVDPHIVPCVKHLHSAPVAARDGFDQRCIRSPWFGVTENGLDVPTPRRAG